jgi:hypothetical protein
MVDPRQSAIARERAIYRLGWMEEAARSRGIKPTKVEPKADGGADNFVDGISPTLELYWSLEMGGEDLAAAELCLWFTDNPLHEHTYCLYIRYSGTYDVWEFGFDRSPDSLNDSSRARRLAQAAFGFSAPATRQVYDGAAKKIINALCAGFAATMPKDKPAP